jgi:hypothetical protein
LIIHARGVNAAFHVSLLLYAAQALLYGAIGMLWFVGFNPPAAIPEDGAEIALLDPEQESLLHRRGDYVQTSGHPEAAMLAARFSRDRKLHYAALRYLISCYLVNIEPMDLHPHYGVGVFKTSPFPADHVWFANSIMSACGGIDELGLLVAASRERPSLIDGAWNPKIREPLEQRLRARGVNLTDDMIWHVRGSIVALQRSCEHELQRLQRPLSHTALYAIWKYRLSIR